MTPEKLALLIAQNRKRSTWVRTTPAEAEALLAVVATAQAFVDAEDEWHLRHGMGRERIPYRKVMDAENKRLRDALARLDPKETP